MTKISYIQVIKIYVKPRGKYLFKTHVTVEESKGEWKTLGA